MGGTHIPAEMVVTITWSDRLKQPFRVEPGIHDAKHLWFTQYPLAKFFIALPADVLNAYTLELVI